MNKIYIFQLYMFVILINVFTEFLDFSILNGSCFLVVYILVNPFVS